MKLHARSMMIALAFAVGCGEKSEPPAPSAEQSSVRAPPPKAPERFGEEKPEERNGYELEEKKVAEAPPPMDAPRLSPAQPEIAMIPIENRAMEPLAGKMAGPDDAFGRDAGLAGIVEDSKPADPAKPVGVKAPVPDPEPLDDGEGARGGEGRRYARRDGDMAVVSTGADAERFSKPEKVLPRTFYFENTYLGGSAAYAERLRRLDESLGANERHYRRVQAETQPFDPPEREGLALRASVDATHIERGQRVFLQIGLQGSARYGWRRPALDLVLVVDQAAFARGPKVVASFITEVLRKLGPADRFGIVLAGQGNGELYVPLSSLAPARQLLARTLDTLAAPPSQDQALARAMERAAAMLAEASEDEAVVPGSQTVMVLTGGDGSERVATATQAAHSLTIQGAITSVFALDTQQGEWWQVANAGYGNFHRVAEGAFASAIDEELTSLSRVVARLVRVNVRLGKNVDAVRVLGTRVLEQAEVDAVKARELAQDRNLSKSMGISSNRGEDDDGIQTVIPYFYGDDSHVILIELWVEEAGTIADVSLRYKDMLNLENAESRTSVVLGSRPQSETPDHLRIAQNVRGFMLGESLQHAANRVRAGDAAGALDALEGAGGLAAETNDADRAAVRGLRDLVVQPSWQSDYGRRQAVEETLLISGQRRVGDTNQQMDH